MTNIITKTIDNFSSGTIVKCYCNKCGKEINHNVLKSIKEDWEEDVREYGIDGFSDYQIIKCVGCDFISFRELAYFSEDRDYDSDGTNEILYPQSTVNHRLIKQYDDLPYNLKEIYAEAIRCFNNNQYILCATGIRSILDGICIERKIRKGYIEISKIDGTIIRKTTSKLDGKINGLKENDIITKSQMQALHELRFLGNKAVHELEVPARNDLNIAFEIIEHILLDIYDLPIKSSKLEFKRKMKT